MMAGMGEARDPGLDSFVDHQRDEITDPLPRSMTTFVGRQRELDELRSLFREGKRLVTLVGMGGIGKTRLALELGFSVSDLGLTGVYLVELASLTNPDLVDGAVLESVGGGSSRSPLQAAVEYLRDATALLVLDCCEHVLDAARARVLSAAEIADGLGDHLRLLRGGRRSDPRHQTIRASLDWSHELLTDRERQLFARLSVFPGSFDLEAAAAVCAGGAIVPGEILDEIQGLVDKSLLAVERRAGVTRFRMLDFVRQYAAERLATAGECPLLADRHRTYFRELAERADRELWALTPVGRTRLDDESPNLRAAIDNGCDRAPDDALAMAGALGLYWRVRGRLAEGVTATEQSLRAQRTQVAERIDRLQQLSAGLDRMIDAHERGLLLTVEQQAAIFGPQWNPDWPAQARQRYGDTTQWQQYAERSASRGPEEWQAIADTIAGLDRALEDAMDAGVTPGSPEANQLVEWHREVFASYFPLTRQMQVCLGRMYEADPAFAAHYDGIRAGFATWFRRIIDASARPQHRPRHRDLAVERGSGSLHPWGRPTPSRTRRFGLGRIELTDYTCGVPLGASALNPR
jgi:predicted ATPase